MWIFQPHPCNIPGTNSAFPTDLSFPPSPPPPPTTGVLPKEPLSVPESPLLTSGAPAATLRPELRHPSGLGCLLPRGLAGPPVLLRDTLKGRLQDLGAEGRKHACETGEEKAGFGLC